MALHPNGIPKWPGLWFVAERLPWSCGLNLLILINFLEDHFWGGESVDSDRAKPLEPTEASHLCWPVHRLTAKQKANGFCTGDAPPSTWPLASWVI